jgi:HTH-type transcriptional regulator / antitoxin HipB
MMLHPLLTATQLGHLLLSARKAKKLTQADLAARVGVSQARISQMEMQPETITAQQLLLLTSVLDLELSLGPRATLTPNDSMAGLDW